MKKGIGGSDSICPATEDLIMVIIDREEEIGKKSNLTLRSRRKL